MHEMDGYVRNIIYGEITCCFVSMDHCGVWWNLHTDEIFAQKINFSDDDE